MLSTLTSPSPSLTSHPDMIHSVTRSPLAESDPVGGAPDEQHHQVLLLRGHLMTLLAARLPADADAGNPSAGSSDLAGRVRALFGEEIPGDALRAQSLLRRMTEVAPELLAALPLPEVPGEPDASRAGPARIGFDATRIREGIRTATSWKQAGISPHPHTLTAVTQALCGHVTTLVPYTWIHLGTLAPESRPWTACREAIERAQEARDTAPEEGLEGALERAFHLAVHTEALLRYAEQDRERSGW